MRTTVYKYEAELQSLQTELSRAKAEVKAEEVRMTTVSLLHTRATLKLDRI